MTDTNRCPRCQSILPEDASDGLCPRCVVELRGEGAEDSSVRSTMKLLGDLSDDEVVEREVVTSPGAFEERKAPFRYTLSRLQSEGGLGRVWLAHDASIGRDVALKELRPHQAENAEARKRFINEAQITGQLEHPNIVPVYEVGWRPEVDLPYYTMRYLRGKTLGQTIGEYTNRRRSGTTQPLELRRLLSAFVSVCNAIAYAHSRSVVHRDLKPDNVVLGAFGELILLDWGLAKIVGDGEPEGEDAAKLDTENLLATQVGTVMGTLAYMAPEQAEGHGARVGPHTDIYGLGAILFEILTGSPPHTGNDVNEVLERIVSRETPRPRAMDASVPAALDAVCRRAMAKEPEDRYSKAGEVADDIDRWLADEPVSAHREPWTHRTARWVRRHQSWVVAGAAALVVILLVVGIAAIRLGSMAERERELRQQGIRGSARFAARTVASEIDLRWRILETAAGDEVLRGWLTTLNRAELPLEHPDRNMLQAWLQSRFDRHFETTKAVSWFLTGKRGLQLARVPFSETTIGKSFAFRDYFHGLGLDLAPEDAGEVEPIRRVHRSIVFESQATRNRMVAFSVPVWKGGANGSRSEVLGVLAMTVELGRFGVLQIGLGSEQLAVLVETGKDWQGRRGLILHHPHLAKLRLSQRSGGALTTYYVSPEQTETMTSLRRAKLAQEEARAKLSWEEQITLDEAPLAGSFATEYRDPVGGDFGGAWLAAFDPVLVKGREDEVRDTGWVVVVQERRESDGP